MRLIDISDYEWKGAEIQWVERNDYSISLRRMPLYKIPTVDAVPVVHGKWIPDTAFGNDIMSNGMAVLCSECGQGHFRGKTNYCPKCGAKMDGGDADADSTS